MMKLDFICPQCRVALIRKSETEWYCADDDLCFKSMDNIWRFILPADQEHFGQFINNYETIRRAEDRFSTDSTYFQKLPFEDASQRRVSDWRIRSISYQMLLKKVIEPQEKSGRKLKILDMGAGNCWLSYRLAQRGHSLAALDLLLNNWDGLGAHRHYPVAFEVIQAVFDRVPFADNQFDLIIFNASIHYSEEYAVTLQEMLRCLKSLGQIVIMDSPLYTDQGSAKQMVIEREQHFEAAYGFKSNALNSENFFTHSHLLELEQKLSIMWRIYRPYYGLKWWIRPLLAKIRGHRQPARFVLLVTTRKKGV